MKQSLTLATVLIISLAIPGPGWADVSESSTDAGTFDIGTPFTSSILIAANEVISDVTVSVNMDHSWIGDITATLTHVESGLVIVLVPGSLTDDSNLGHDTSGSDDLVPDLYEFSNAGQETIADAAAALPGTGDEVPAGTYLADGNFATIFAGDVTQGTWTLSFIDSGVGDAGNIDGWFINFSSTIPEPGSATVIGVCAWLCLVRGRRQRKFV